MPLSLAETQELSEQLLTLQRQTRQELEQSQQQLQEIRLLLSQTGTEVEKLAQRELALANRVRDMEAHLENYSRADIRTLYNANHEVQLRLFMMRSQAEQLETRQQNIRDYQEKLRAILELTATQVDLARTAEFNAAATLPTDDERAREATQQTTAAVFTGKEEERLQLARDLQDGPTQALTNILLHLEVCRQVLKFDADAAQQELDALRGMLLGALRDTRRLLAQIRPLALDDLGLAETLRRDLDELGREHGISVTVEEHLTESLPRYLQVTLFRLLQRAATALVTPGQPGRLTAALQTEPGQVVAQLELAGRDLADSHARAEAYLTNPTVAHQFDALGGHARIDTTPDGCLALTYAFPYEPAA